MDKLVSRRGVYLWALSSHPATSAAEVQPASPSEDPAISTVAAYPH